MKGNQRVLIRRQEPWEAKSLSSTPLGLPRVRADPLRKTGHQSHYFPRAMHLFIVKPSHSHFSPEASFLGIPSKQQRINISLKSSLVLPEQFLNLSNFSMCNFNSQNPPMVAGEFWELQSAHLNITEVDKFCIRLQGEKQKKGVVFGG